MKSSVKHFWTDFRKFDGLAVGHPRYNNIASDRRQTKEECSYIFKEEYRKWQKIDQRQNKEDHVPQYRRCQIDSLHNEIKPEAENPVRTNEFCKIL